MKYPCNLIKDILPLYHDDACSTDSKQAVEEHLTVCSDCKNYYQTMCDADVVEALSYDNETEIKKANSFKSFRKKLTRKNILMGIGIVLGTILLYLVYHFIIGAGFLFLISKGYEAATIDVYTDISQYEKYMVGEDAEEEFQNKWGMDETIFPEEITNTMNVTDYKMVYYNPWDAQYLGYLTVDYDENDYKNEVQRLTNYDSTEYLGYYSVTGFPEEYTLLAMYADAYQGFVYALTDNDDTIIYVEIIFCNYFLDVECTDYIPKEYLPLGFDASDDNPYREKMLDE